MRNWELTDWRTSPWWQIFNDFAYWGEDLSGKYQPDDEEKLEEGIDYLIPAPDLFLEWVKKGYVTQYRITPSSTYPNSVCDYCRKEQGIHRLDSRSILPPFHPNCRCMMTLLWKNDADKYEGLKDVYNPYNGKILHELCTKEIILDMLSTALAEECKLEEKVSWSDVNRIGFWDGDFSHDIIHDYSFDPSKHVGWETTLCVNTCINIDWTPPKRGENTLDYWTEKAIEKGKEIKESYQKQANNYYSFAPGEAMELGIAHPYTQSYGEYIGTVLEKGKFDLKYKEGTIFGARNSDGGRKYYAFVYQGHLLPFDAPGNILPGIIAYHVGTIHSEMAKLLGDINSVRLHGTTDDPFDKASFDLGYEYAKTGVWNWNLLR